MFNSIDALISEARALDDRVAAVDSAVMAALNALPREERDAINRGERAMPDHLAALYEGAGRGGGGEQADAR